ncbi:MAG TPA: hypothetical protein VKA95_15840 [Nitrososphaeraceae archaeon]|nr:hypothetical protein [Nitrososphaeraceae archaeon]
MISQSSPFGRRKKDKNILRAARPVIDSSITAVTKKLRLNTGF